jgi:hypothetical protein
MCAFNTSVLKKTSRLVKESSLRSSSFSMIFCLIDDLMFNKSTVYNE